MNKSLTHRMLSGICADVCRGWRLSYETELFVIGSTVQVVQADAAE
ncbi:MAG TPA: hypothetical protein VFR90_04025 [Methylibium sp.]|nr:hypothetical protein [Methylibium sp.]HEU4458267.1 hypothetical protein [Methylibium sp.]